MLRVEIVPEAGIWDYPFTPAGIEGPRSAPHGHRSGCFAAPGAVSLTYGSRRAADGPGMCRICPEDPAAPAPQAINAEIPQVIACFIYE